MRKLTSILATLLIAAFAVGPVSVAAAPNAPITTVAQNATATVQGTVKDDSGAPVAGATVALRGPSQYGAISDSTGAFTFSDVAPGVYVLSAQKPGYQSASESDFAVLGGQTQTVQVVIHAETFTSLRTIATVRSTGQASFNTSTASVNVVNAQAFVNQGEPQVQRLLNQIPGVQSAMPNSSANAAVNGAVTVPSVRNSFSFETQTLIDGHPLAVGDYGDYVSTFLNSFMLGSVEVVKGPGATVPDVNYAINGTVNFRTKDPTATFTPDYTFGYTNRGGTFYNMGVSDTIGRFGFVVDVAGIDDVPGLNGYSTYFQTYTNNAVADVNGTQTNLSYNYTYIPDTVGADNGPFVPGTYTRLNSTYGLLACCYTYSGDYDQTAELLKFRYKFSNATTATVSYLGGQTFADQNANTSELIPSVFAPAALGTTQYTYPAYTAAASASSYGPLAANTALLIPNSVYPETAQEVNNEPIFQAEVRSLIGNDTILARFYHASISRLIYEGQANPANPVVGYYQLYGVLPSSKASCSTTTCAPETFDGGTYPVSFYDWYNQWEIDHLSGLSLEYDHGWGEGSDFTLSVDRTDAASSVGTWSSSFPGVVTGTNTLMTATTATQTPSVSIPVGTSQVNTTFLGRFIYDVTPKLTGTLALYDNQYYNTFPYQCNASGAYTAGHCAIDGSNAYFTSTNTSHFDQRLAFEYRPSTNLAIRASAGSSIAPPYMLLLTKVNTATTCTGGVCSFSSNNANLTPETGFGYDLGADYRINKYNITISGDAYLENVFNHFLAEEYQVGTCGSNTAGVTCPTGSPATDPVNESFNTNVSNVRYEGVELAAKRVVPEGWGFDLSAAVEHAYAYDLGPNFYCAGLAPGVACTPATYNVNLPIIPGENFVGNVFGYQYNPAAPTGSSLGTSGFVSSGSFSVPYLQGNADVNYTTSHGWYFLLGETLYGKNNSLNVPPFGIGFATIRIPLNSSVSFQVSGDNIFNAYTGIFPIAGRGIADPLANGTLGATIQNTLGPATYNFILTKTLNGP